MFVFAAAPWASCFPFCSAFLLLPPKGRPLFPMVLKDGRYLKGTAGPAWEQRQEDTGKLLMGQGDQKEPSMRSGETRVTACTSHLCDLGQNPSLSFPVLPCPCLSFPVLPCPSVSFPVLASMSLSMTQGSNRPTTCVYRNVD